MKHKHSFSIPRISLSDRPVDFSPALVTDNDELAQAIDNDATVRDDTWELNERPDTGELTDYWQSVEDDIRKDPEWFTFSDS